MSKLYDHAVTVAKAAIYAVEHLDPQAQRYLRGKLDGLVFACYLDLGIGEPDDEALRRLRDNVIADARKEDG